MGQDIARTYFNHLKGSNEKVTKTRLKTPSAEIMLPRDKAVKTPIRRFRPLRFGSSGLDKN